MHLLLLISALLLAQTAIYRAIFPLQTTYISQNLSSPTQSSLSSLRNSFSTRFREHQHPPYNKASRKNDTIANTPAAHSESSPPLIAPYGHLFATHAPDRQSAPRRASNLATPHASYADSYLSETNEWMHHHHRDVNSVQSSTNITASMLPYPRKPPLHHVNPSAVPSIMHKSGDKQLQMPSDLIAEYNQAHTHMPTSLSSTWEKSSIGPSLRPYQETPAASFLETPLSPEPAGMIDAAKLNSSINSSVAAGGAMFAQPRWESPMPTAFAESDVFGTTDPGQGVGRHAYPTLLLDRTETFEFDSNVTVRCHVCLFSDCGDEFQKIAVFDVEQQVSLEEGGNKAYDSQRDRGLDSSKLGRVGQYQKRVLVLQFCVWSRRSNSPVNYGATQRTTAYAFDGDPLGTTPSLIAASGTDPKDGLQPHCEESLRLEVPLSPPRIFVMVSRPKTLHHALVNVSSSITSFKLLKSRVTSWNSRYLSAAQSFFDDSGRSANAFSRVYILSSLPYMEHYELDALIFDTKGLAVMNAATSGNEKTGYFCDPTGTEIAAAVAGRTLGMRHFVNTSIVPVPIRSCLEPATEDRILRALLWVYGEMLQRSGEYTIIVTEQFPDRVLSSKAVSKALSALGNGGSFIFIPTSACPSSALPFLSIGAYGQKGPGLYKVGFVKQSCASGIDVFAPGINVGGISNIGPWAYRNISSAPHIAAAGIASLFLSILPHLRNDFNVSDLKEAIGISASVPSLVVLNDNLVTTNFPLVRAHMLPVLLNTILREYGHLTDAQENKAASSLIPNFPNGALIGVCAAAGAIIVAMIVGAVLAIQRNNGNASDFSYMTGEPPTRDGNAGYDRVKTELEASSKLPEEVYARQGSEAAVAEHVVHANTSSPIRRHRSNHNPLVEIGRLLSITKNKESPATPNAKPSWFATPKGPVNQSFGAKATPGGEASLKGSCVLDKEKCSNPASEKRERGTSSMETKKVDEN